MRKGLNYVQSFSHFNIINIALEKNKDYLNETVLVQGVIDCLLDEGDGLVVIDYKTDRVDAGRLEKMADLYRVQLNIYARAAEAILKRHVKEKYLYLFHYNKIVRV